MLFGFYLENMQIISTAVLTKWLFRLCPVPRESEFQHRIKDVSIFFLLTRLKNRKAAIDALPTAHPDSRQDR